MLDSDTILITYFIIYICFIIYNLIPKIFIQMRFRFISSFFSWFRCNKKSPVASGPGSGVGILSRFFVGNVLPIIIIKNFLSCTKK